MVQFVKQAVKSLFKYGVGDEKSARNKRHKSLFDFLIHTIKKNYRYTFVIIKLLLK